MTKTDLSEGVGEEDLVEAKGEDSCHQEAGVQQEAKEKKSPMQMIRNLQPAKVNPKSKLRKTTTNSCQKSTSNYENKVIQ